MTLSLCFCYEPPPIETSNRFQMLPEVEDEAVTAAPPSVESSRKQKEETVKQENREKSDANGKEEEMENRDESCGQVKQNLVDLL